MPTDADLGAAEMAIADAAEQIESAGVDEEAFQTGLTARLQQRQSQLTAMKTTDTDTKTKARLNAEFGYIARKVPAPVGLVMDATAEATETSGAALDRAVWQSEVQNTAKTLLKHCQNTTKTLPKHY